MNVHIYKTKEEMAYELALWMCDIIKLVLKEQEYFTLALSGGETPQLLFEKLATPEFKEKIDWKRIHIFWGDERAVPYTDERNNAKVAYDILIDHINIPAAQVHKMRTDIEPVFAAKEYEKILHTYFDNTVKSFDLVLLGMGSDGHTLSVFPGSPLIENEAQHWVNAVFNEEQQMYRITMTPFIVNRASYIAFMIAGQNKAAILKQVIEGSYHPASLPSQLIKPTQGELIFFLDESVAKDLVQ